MNINTAFPSNYLNAAALNGKRAKVRVAKVVTEEIAAEHKPVVYFEGKERGLVLNKTNAGMLSEIAKSDETDDWIGLDIVLYVAKVDFQGRRVDAVRVDYPAGKPAPIVTSVANDDDTIPF